MDRLYEAKIDTIVLRPFFYRGKTYQIDDIFLYNPNNKEQRDFVRNSRIKQLEEDKYSYICLREQRDFFDKTYRYGEIVDISQLEVERRLLYIRRGWFKKVITENIKIEEVIKLPVVFYVNGENVGSYHVNSPEDLQFDLEKGNNPNSELAYSDKINISIIAKSKGMKPIDLRNICNEQLEMGIIHYTKFITEEDFDKIITHLNGN